MRESFPKFKECLEEIFCNEKLLNKVHLKTTVNEKKKKIKNHIKSDSIDW